MFEMAKKMEYPAGLYMHSVICFLNAENVPIKEIHCWIAAICSNGVMDESWVIQWVWKFNVCAIKHVE